MRPTPDVVLLDVHLPSGTGDEVVRAVHVEPPDVRFLALSVSDAAEDVIRVIRAGARGYVTKSIGGDELADAIERVAAGDAVFSPRLAGFVLDAFTRDAVAAPEPTSELDVLTPREREVLQLIARGYTYREARERAVPVDQDDRDPRLGGAAQAAADQPPGAHALGDRAAAAALTASAVCRGKVAGHAADPDRLATRRVLEGQVAQLVRASA